MGVKYYKEAWISFFIPGFGCLMLGHPFFAAFFFFSWLPFSFLYIGHPILWVMPLFFQLNAAFGTMRFCREQREKEEYERFKEDWKKWTKEERRAWISKKSEEIRRKWKSEGMKV